MLLKRIKEDPRFNIAVAVGYKFRLDPVVVLKSDWFDWAVRLCALQVVHDAEEEANPNSKKTIQAEMIDF